MVIHGLSRTQFFFALSSSLLSNQSLHFTQLLPNIVFYMMKMMLVKRVQYHQMFLYVSKLHTDSVWSSSTMILKLFWTQFLTSSFTMNAMVHGKTQQQPLFILQLSRSALPELSNLIYEIYYIYTRSFPGGSSGKGSAHNVRDLGSIPGRGRSPGGGDAVFLPGECHGQWKSGQIIWKQMSMAVFQQNFTVPWP